MTVKTKKAKKMKQQKPPLTLPEKECRQAIADILAENGGRIPKLAEIVDKIGGRVKESQVSRLRTRLEEKGYYSERAEVAS